MIFVKTFMDKGSMKVKPLAGQKLDSGEKIDIAWMVQCDKDIRTRYAPGSTFVVDKLKKEINVYVAVGQMKVLHREPVQITDMASEEAFAEWEKLVGGGITDTTFIPGTSVAANKVSVTYMDRLRRNKELKPPVIEEDGFYVDEEIWYLSVRNILQQIPTIYTGPSGLGKTSLCELLCKRLGLQFSEFDMGTMLDPHAGLLGTHRMTEKGSIFDYARFTQVIKKPGIILLDEISRAVLASLNILFPVCDHRRKLYNDIAPIDGERVIDLHEGCSIVATANEGGQYTGTVQLDLALRKRFNIIELDFMQAVHEVRVLKIRSEIPETSAIKIVSVANSVRSIFKNGELSDAPGTRETLMAADMVRDGYSPVKALEYSFLPLFEGTKTEGERSKVLFQINSK